MYVCWVRKPISIYECVCVCDNNTYVYIWYSHWPATMSELCEIFDIEKYIYKVYMSAWERKADNSNIARRAIFRLSSTYSKLFKRNGMISFARLADVSSTHSCNSMPQATIDLYVYAKFENIEFIVLVVRKHRIHCFRRSSVHDKNGAISSFIFA